MIGSVNVCAFAALVTFEFFLVIVGLGMLYLYTNNKPVTELKSCIGCLEEGERCNACSSELEHSKIVETEGAYDFPFEGLAGL